MKNITIPKNYACFANASDLLDLCNPLFHHSPIDMFTYARTYKNGDFFALNTNTAYEEHLIYNFKGDTLLGFDLLDTIANSKEFSKNKNKTSWFITDVFRGDYWRMIVDSFKIKSYLCISEKGKNYYELFFFASLSGKDIASFYINHYDVLENFMLYFREYGTDLIKISESNKIILPARGSDSEYYKITQNLEEELTNGKFDPDILSNRLKLKKYPLHHKNTKIQITFRELECLRCLAQGMTAKESASILQVSHRTIETHLQNIKNKLGISFQSQLLQAYNSSPLINLLGN